MSLQATVIREVLQSAASHGAAYDTLCQLTGVTNEEISDSTKMVEWEKAALIWNPLLQLSGDELIGLHLGMEMNITMIGMVGFLMQSSKDLEQAYQTFCHYSALVTPMVDFKYITKETVSIELIQNKIWPAKYPETASQAMDFALAAIVKFLRTLSGKNIMPIRVETEYCKRGVAEYQKMFQCEVIFNAKINKVLLRKEDLKHPVVSNDKSLFDLFDSILAQKKAAIEESRCSENLKQILFMQFKGRIPTIEEAALALNMTTRTLQRKLLEEKTTFRAIANKVREELALQLMKNPAVKVSEVSEVLGYSDLTAFRRAFKSWTKETPKIVKHKLNKSSIL